MKIRHGFVSNSSTSSFCIFGVKVPLEDIAIKFDLPNIFDNGHINWEYIWEDVTYKIMPKLGFNLSEYDCEDGFVYFGRDIDNHTTLEQLQTIEETTQRLFNKQSKFYSGIYPD